MIKYSEKEKYLFKTLGYEYLFDFPVEPYTLYRIAAENAFINNHQGPIIDALRKGLRAFTESKPYRLTKEFDDLITFD